MSDRAEGFDSEYTLDHRYTRTEGRVFLTGTQALVRLPILQSERDRQSGLDTAGFISGYRGSPLGGYDLALWQAQAHLEAAGIRFEPGVNEDLAATAVWGSQLAAGFPGSRHDGVFGLWYGKGPGVDRSCDALKHGNYQGTSEYGGVLVLAGDDPGARSSSIAHESEPALVHMGIPVLNPSTVQDYLDLGLLGFAMSRFSGCWIGFKCVTDTVESAASVEVGEQRAVPVLPGDFEIPDASRRGAPVGSEEALYHERLPAVQAFARANGMDRVVIRPGKARIGIVTTGKAYLDVRQALDELGLDERRCLEEGLGVYKVALSWPLEPRTATEFAGALDHVLVVEEKRPLIEDQLRALLYDRGDRPSLEGKKTVRGERLVPDTGELSPRVVRDVLHRWLKEVAPKRAAVLPDRPEGVSPRDVATVTLSRSPSFCAGCPHNRSTQVPEGSVAGGGIGCHGMAAWMPTRRIALFSHMGGEGANWIGISPFTETRHVFQNLGDGTYFHSGLLAVRANVAAGTNITYKILNNGAVAMTGGQAIEGESLEGEVTTPEIARQLSSEGVRRVAVVSDDPGKYPEGAFDAQVGVYGRDELDRVQRELREIPGVTALVYDQTCAAEARRLRRRGEFPDPDRRLLIHEGVCEGCGDCGVQSNCIALEPVETEFGRKRQINQSICNKDFSCLDGHCPSFVSVVGGRLRSAATERLADSGRPAFPDLEVPDPPRPDRGVASDVLVAGIGGTGVVTVGALLGMAAHLEGRGCSVLDVTGLSQKNGSVTSHVRVASDFAELHATRIADGGADLLLGCDLVVATSTENLSKISSDRTAVIVNRFVTPTAAFASDPDLDLSAHPMLDAVGQATGGKRLFSVDATRVATALLGDAIFANPFLLGLALQQGRLPVGLASLRRAIELNGRSVEANLEALQWGRLAAVNLEAVQRCAGLGGLEKDPKPVSDPPETLSGLVARCEELLKAYQGPSYAARFRQLVESAASSARAAGASEAFPEAVARSYSKLLAYKDEYEVARLLSDPDFRERVEAEFDGDFRLVWHAAPPRLPGIDRVWNRRDAETNRTRKLSLGPWVFPLLGWLARLRFLRGSPLDPFGGNPHRKLERRWIGEYEETVGELLAGLNFENSELAARIAGLPEGIRGFEDVKEDSAREVFRERDELMTQFRAFERNSDSME
ncbi:MAG: indolepyruvate ferredoxin oxidoreductase family protein [Myxococcota bacterium]|nr:indolepyruvate ferredoxin oxidoreductase family protein [Myxococcota bacterium]